MKNNHKLILIPLVLIISTVNLFASFEFWVGTGFIEHTYNVDPAEKNNFEALTSSKDMNAISAITYIGPSIDMSFYPNYKVPIGLKISTQFLFPCGFKTTTMNSYSTNHFDFKNRNMISLCYAQSYSDVFGLFADFGYEIDFFRMVKENTWNSKEASSYHKFSNQFLWGELGFLTTISNGYFKFGVNYSHSILNKASGFDLVFSGGFRF